MLYTQSELLLLLHVQCSMYTFMFMVNITLRFYIHRRCPRRSYFQIEFSFHFHSRRKTLCISWNLCIQNKRWWFGVSLLLSSSFVRSCSCSLSLCLPRSVCCLSCTCFSVFQLIYFLCVENRNESEKRTQARRRQCRRKSWYDDGDNIVWSRIACAFSFLYFFDDLLLPRNTHIICQKW